MGFILVRSISAQANHFVNMANVLQNAQRFAEALSERTSNRDIFATKDGLLGHGPLSVGKGDQVWLVVGSRMPLVFRLAEVLGSFTMVGETYVHGCMNG